ncbi:MAG: hypothetical protein ACPLF9_08855, partial [Methanothermobacter tenebrarum]
MSTKIWGRLIFILFIWFFSLRYYWECLNLRQPSEKLTIVAAFWALTILAAWEVGHLLKKILKERNLLTLVSTKSLSKILRDKRIWLVGAVILYVIFIPIAGFYLTSFVAFCVFSFILGSRSPVKIIVSGAVVIAIIYGIFS